MQDNCIFCKIIGGEIPAAILYEDEDFMAIMDIFPAAKGHTIIVAKRHVANLFELDDVTAAKALVLARKLANAIQAELNCDGMNLLQNNGEAAGQTIFHFHIHLIPRYHEDKVKMTWTHGQYEEGEAASLAASIRTKVK